MVVNLVDKLTSIPSKQSADHGYTAMVEQNELYTTFRTNVPWDPAHDTGPCRNVDPTATYYVNKQSGIIYNANKKVFNLEENINRAVIQALNQAVSYTYKHAGGIHSVFKSIARHTVLKLL